MAPYSFLYNFLFFQMWVSNQISYKLKLVQFVMSKVFMFSLQLLCLLCFCKCFCYFVCSWQIWTLKCLCLLCVCWTSNYMHVLFAFVEFELQALNQILPLLFDVLHISHQRVYVDACKSLMVVSWVGLDKHIQKLSRCDSHFYICIRWAQIWPSTFSFLFWKCYFLFMFLMWSMKDMVVYLIFVFGCGQGVKFLLLVWWLKNSSLL